MLSFDVQINSGQKLHAQCTISNKKTPSDLAAHRLIPVERDLAKSIKLTYLIDSLKDAEHKLKNNSEPRRGTSIKCAMNLIHFVPLK